MSEDWLNLTACEQGRAIGRGEIDPSELLDRYFAAIEGSDVTPAVYARLTKERAVAEAEAAARRARIGRRLSLLDGVPVSWKDLFDTAGTETEAGSRLLRGRVPESNAGALRIAASSGLVCLGKTHLTELAYSALGLNPITATPPCINGSGLAPGGSSSGAAASVAFGLASAAVGSDTGGSVRIPAAWNDLVGLKTTHGLIPLGGVVPLCPRFDTAGPIVKCVEDAAAMLSALAGTRPPDLEGARLDGVRILVLETVAFDGLDDRCAEGFELAAARMRSAGAVLVPARIPAVAAAEKLSACLYGVEAYSVWSEAIKASPDVMFVEIRDRIQSGKEFSGKDFAQAWQKLEELRADFRSAAAGFDAVAIPTSPILPPETRRLLSDRAYYGRNNRLAGRNTRIANMMELPALTLPTGVPSVGVMLLGKPFEEAKLLRLGKALETGRAG